MLKQANNNVIVIIIVLIAFIFANVDFNRNTDSLHSRFIAGKFPENVNGWLGYDHEFNKTSGIFKILSREDFILRVYKKEGEKNINLALILADNKSKVHDPQVCYKLQGFEFFDEKRTKLSSNLIANCIKTKKEGREYLFIYWYTDLDKNYTTREEFWREIAFKKIFGKPIKSYGIVILYTPVENTEDLTKFAIKINKYLFMTERKNIF